MRKAQDTKAATSALQTQARALGDPTRHAVFRHIADARGPVDIAELTEQFGLNHNAIRQHIAKLVAAGLLIEAKAPRSGPGRPRLVYTLDPAAEGRWGTTGPYERLSSLLVEIIRTGRSAEEVGRRAADQFRVAAPSGDVSADMAEAMARQGFDPEVRTLRRGSEIVLHTCPFATAAVADRHTICSLHLGIAEGLAEGTDAGVDELVANDPRRAGCRVRISALGDIEARPAGTLSLRGRRAGG
jgi:predicted ArsR family transcriptional regulator